MQKQAPFEHSIVYSLQFFLRILIKKTLDGPDILLCVNFWKLILHPRWCNTDCVGASENVVIDGCEEPKQFLKSC